MDQNTLVAMLFYVLGGLAGATFYLPFKGVKKWSWESYWMVYALAALVIVPWALALSLTPVLDILRATDGKVLVLCFVFGAMWGVGGLTWGLMIRYLGVGLGLAIGCGLCAATGTLAPPIRSGTFMQLFQSTSGIATLAGVAVSLLGIIITGVAGMSKESELSEEEKKKAVAEFNFPKGLIIAIFSGAMSAGMFLGIDYGKPINDHVLKLNIDPLWQGLPVLVVVLAGGFTVNFLWCLGLNFKNRSGGDYVNGQTALVGNYVLSGLAGFIWYLQFLTATMADKYIAKQYSFLKATLLMSSAIIFSTILGIFLHEWRGCSARTKLILAVGLILLVLAACILGYGNYAAEQAKTAATQAK